MVSGHVQVEEQAVEGNGPKGGPVVRQGCMGEMTPCQSKEEEPQDVSNLTTVFQDCLLRQVCAEGVSKICLRSVHLLYSHCVGAFPSQWLP